IGVWVNEMPDGDPTRGRISVWNLWEHLGYPPQPHADYGRWAALVHPDDRAAIQEARERYFRGETPSFESQVRLRAADGSYLWFLVRGVVARNTQGTPIRFVGSGVDITDARRAEERLRASEQRFRTFVEHATDAFVLYDERGVILDVNRQMCENLG